MIEFLRVFQFNDKIRLGNNFDGGYVIGNFNIEYDCYISAGISDEESFTRDFLSRYNYITKENSYAFDKTIKDYPWEYTKNIIWKKNNIGSVNNQDTTNLEDLLNKYDRIFLKMDIEGGEYDWILSLDEKKLRGIKQMVIEFHGINDNTWGCGKEDKMKCLQKLFNSHYIIHVHGNNHAKTTNGIPDVIEITYVSKDLLSRPLSYNTTPLPIKGIDYSNVPDGKDYDLNLSPFVFNLK
jgi:hypothetical protein